MKGKASIKLTLNAPNILTIFRIILSPLFLFILVRPDDMKTVVGVLIIFTITTFTDFLDGFLARKYNQVTNFGKIFDPIADKLLMTFALVSFAILGLLFWWVAILILLREIGITIHRFYLLSKGKVVMSMKLGKLKMFAQSLMIGAILVWKILTLSSGYYHETAIISTLTMIMFWISQLLIWSALVLTVLSGGEYLLAVSKKS